jgi:molybdopterin molybdotransferase
LSEFFRVATLSRVISELASFGRLAAERVGLSEAYSRVLTEDIVSPEDLPPLPRSTMDGYALSARDTFGASDALPALIEVAGRVEMGSLPDFELGPGKAAQIPTGGFLPEGADAVVMVEYTSMLDESTVEVTKPVTAGENVLLTGEDVARGEAVIEAGTRLLAHHVGLLAGLGMLEVPVHKRPVVAVLSTGDEVVPVDKEPGPGQVRDINSHAIAGLVRSAGATPKMLGLVPDRRESLKIALEHALSQTDVAVLSGGSSVGERDLMVEVASSLEDAEVLVHGVAINPGKPTLLARVGAKPVLGLPGHPVSAMVVAMVFLVPFLRFLEGEPMKPGPLGPRVRASLATSVPSAQGRADFVRVRIEAGDQGFIAHPVFGKSGVVSTMVRAHGLVPVHTHSEGLARGEEVEVILLKEWMR